LRLIYKNLSLDYLKLKKHLVFKHHNVGIFKQGTGKYIPLAVGEKGISAILGCTPHGKFLAIEVKQTKGRPTLGQLAFIDRVNKLGGIGFIA